MYKKTITYPSYDGVELTEDFYFNMNRAEILEMELSTEGGLENMIKKIMDAQDLVSLSKYFKKIILMSYGEKSPDGKRFIKVRPDGTRPCDEFAQTEAYSQLYVELATDAQAAADFVNGIIPSEYADEPAQKELTVVQAE